eukprot:m.132064 g.132064  ORF g.132064 m.132064 type:complete len:687 (-) comp29585_c3_seq2:67-2127(-)
MSEPTSTVLPPPPSTQVASTPPPAAPLDDTEVSKELSKVAASFSKPIIHNMEATSTPGPPQPDTSSTIVPPPPVAPVTPVAPAPLTAVVAPPPVSTPTHSTRNAGRRKTPAAVKSTTTTKTKTPLAGKRAPAKKLVKSPARSKAKPKSTTPSASKGQNLVYYIESLQEPKDTSLRKILSGTSDMREVMLLIKENYLAKDSEGFWYRATVTDVRKSKTKGSEFEVQVKWSGYIDDFSWVPYTDDHITPEKGSKEKKFIPSVNVGAWVRGWDDKEMFPKVSQGQPKSTSKSTPKSTPKSKTKPAATKPPVAKPAAAKAKPKAATPKAKPKPAPKKTVEKTTVSTPAAAQSRESSGRKRKATALDLEPPPSSSSASASPSKTPLQTKSQQSTNGSKKTQEAATKKSKTQKGLPSMAEIMSSPSITPVVSSTLFLVRHCERLDRSIESLGGEWLGSAARPHDPPLSKTGHVQAQALGQQLKGKGITRIFTSPLVRAVQTAAIVEKQLDLGDSSIRIEQGFCEEAKAMRNPVPPVFLNPLDLCAYTFSLDKAYTPVCRVSHQYDAANPVRDLKRTKPDCANAEVHTMHEIHALTPPTKTSTLKPEVAEHDLDRITADRCRITIDNLLTDLENKKQTLLIVGHGASIKYCVRRLTCVDDFKAGPVARVTQLIRTGNTEPPFWRIRPPPSVSD